MNATVCIATYGEHSWSLLANDRARPSAETQPAEVVVVHQFEGTVATSRNAAANLANADWLCFLDGDDELAPGFITAIRDAANGNNDPMVLYTPAVQYMLNGRARPPKIWREVPIERGNWMVIGTVVHRDLFFSVGGFKDYGDPPGSNAYEDWSMWARCLKAGATVVKVPQAVYVAHVDFASRHRSANAATKRAWHMEIGADVFPEHYGPGADRPLTLGRIR